MEIKEQKGAIAIEYVFTMIISTIILLGVQLLFVHMSIDILNQFEKWINIIPFN